MVINPTLVKWGVIGLGLLVGAFYIDHRARSQVHEDYRVKDLEAKAEQLTKEVQGHEDRAIIDKENFELVVYLKGTADRARAAEYRVRNKLKEFESACDPTSSAGCAAAVDLSGLLGQCIENYRDLRERSGESFAAGKKCEARYDQVEKASKE